MLPALQSPALGYDDLAIGDGALASVALERLLGAVTRWGHAERIQLRADLMGYCARDTLGLARLLEQLRSLAQGSRGKVTAGVEIVVVFLAYLCTGLSHICG